MSESPEAVIILSGGDLSSRIPHLQLLNGCPALIPIHSKPLASYVIDFYHSQKTRVILAIDEIHRAQIVEYLPVERYGYELFLIPERGNVNDSLKQVLTGLPGLDDVIVNLVTTIPTIFPKPNTVQVSESPVKRGLKVAGVLIKEGKIDSVYSKEDPLPPEAQVFTGVARTKAELLLNNLNSRDLGNDLLNVFVPNILAGDLTAQVCEWIDCGHDRNYIDSRRNMLASRSFNQVSVDGNLAIVKKASTNKPKMLAEALFYQGIPKNLLSYFPRLFDIERKKGEVQSYSIEYFGYPNLAEYKLFWQLSEEKWWVCVEKVTHFLSLCSQTKFEKNPAWLRALHWEKTISRIESYLESISPDQAESFFNDELFINGIRHRSLRSLLEIAKPIIDKHCDRGRVSISHGDLCFNNILFDSISGDVKFIDPRGVMEGEGAPVSGDISYDLAKLNHSLTGGYDFIVNGTYHFGSIPGKGYVLNFPTLHSNPLHRDLSAYIIEALKEDRQKIEVMTGLLFLSMCPLHADDPHRQEALFINGLRILGSALK